MDARQGLSLDDNKGTFYEFIIIYNMYIDTISNSVRIPLPERQSHGCGNSLQYR